MKMLLLILLFIFLVVDVCYRTVDIDGKKINLEIWDTPGGECYRTLIKPYYRSAMVSCGCGESVVRFVILELFI